MTPCLSWGSGSPGEAVLFAMCHSAVLNICQSTFSHFTPDTAPWGHEEQGVRHYFKGTPPAVMGAHVINFYGREKRKHKTTRFFFNQMIRKLANENKPQ